jgi:hypothetical protein
MRMNRYSALPSTYEGGRASIGTPLQQLERAVLSCLLWENQFYESGNDIVKRIEELCEKCDDEDIARLAKKASKQYLLKHVPLLLTCYLAHKAYKETGRLVATVCTRPDFMCELVNMYLTKYQKKSLKNRLKIGLNWAFNSFDEYQLTKWNRKAPVMLRDVAFLAHVKATDKVKGKLFARLLNKSYYPDETRSGFCVKDSYELKEFEKLEPADTWEVALSDGQDKKEVFERLITEKKLGIMAALMNARQMYDSGVSKELFKQSLDSPKRMLPFSFIRCAKAVPVWEDVIEEAMLRTMRNRDRNEFCLLGRTIVLVDVSGSMKNKISSKSETTLLDCACGLAMLLREVCAEIEIVTFSNEVVRVPPRHGFALRDSIIKSQPHGGTLMGKAVDIVSHTTCKRLIVITDEQSHDSMPNPSIYHKYILNIASSEKGVAVDKSWVKVNGFSEYSINYIRELEQIGKDNEED